MVQSSAPKVRDKRLFPSPEGGKCNETEQECPERKDYRKGADTDR